MKLHFRTLNDGPHFLEPTPKKTLLFFWSPHWITMTPQFFKEIFHHTPYRVSPCPLHGR